MLIYSRNIIKFIAEIKNFIYECLSKEIGFEIHSDRFYHTRARAFCPIKIVIYNQQSRLGYYDPNFYELGFHERLMHAQKKQLYDVIRHELAHYITIIEYGSSIYPHGPEFMAFCKEMNWGKEVYAATICLKEEDSPSADLESDILRKVKKLMALSTSSNQNEAELAVIKSQQLLLKHNINSDYIENDDDETFVLKRVMKQKKRNAKMLTIARILQTFFVNTVFNQSSDFVHLEIVGSAINVEVADYVASTLSEELDKLWKISKKEHPSLSGVVAKNSFFLGVARGYCSKMDSLKQNYPSAVTHSLMVIEKKLVDANAMVYPALRSSKSRARQCPHSSSIGEEAGKQLNIRPGISESKKNGDLFIAHALS